MSKTPYRPRRSLFKANGASAWWLLLAVLGFFFLWQGTPRYIGVGAVGAARHRTLPVQQEVERARAVERLRRAMHFLLEARPAESAFSANDPNHTGLIGLEWSSVTSTLGELTAKRTAVSPLWGAVLVDQLTAVGLAPGDRIAVSLSGSFPGLNLAVLAAAQAMGLQVRAVASPTASMYGANWPNWTFPDMLAALDTGEYLAGVSWAVSPGAGSDLGRGLLTGSEEEVQAILVRTGAHILTGDSLAEMVEARWQYMWVDGPLRAFINVGGSHAAMGGCPPPAAWSGWLPAAWVCDGTPGLLWRFSNKGVPVLHLLNIKEMALENGLPLDPVPLPGWNGGET